MPKPCSSWHYNYLLFLLFYATESSSSNRNHRLAYPVNVSVCYLLSRLIKETIVWFQKLVKVLNIDINMPLFASQTKNGLQRLTASNGQVYALLLQKIVSDLSDLQHICCWEIMIQKETCLLFYSILKLFRTNFCLGHLYDKVSYYIIASRKKTKKQCL